MPSSKRILIVGALIVGLFAVGYVLSWSEAYRLSNRFMNAADAAYQRGEYLNAFIGYTEIQPVTGQRVKYGGYYQAANVWRDPFAWPRPAFARRADEHIREIVANRLTIADGERFVQENTGLNNPYFGDVYLRLGELYEESGDPRAATEIYRDVIDLFPNRADLISAASDHLTRLGAQP